MKYVRNISIPVKIWISLWRINFHKRKNLCRRSIVTVFIGLVCMSMHAATVLDVRDFGAKGDGLTDDTEAFLKIDEAMRKTKEPIEILIPAGTFMVNPLKTPVREIAPGVQRRKCLLWIRNDYTRVNCAGQIKIIQDVDYTVGLNKGQEWYWAVILISANNCTVDGLNFDGNGTGTIRGHIASQVNLRWEGVSALGPGNGKDYHFNNKVINCFITGGGGQAIAMQWQKNAIIAQNIVEDSTGMGYSRSENSILTANIATRSHDAPFIANGNCRNISITNNISRHTTNGSGIDVVGCDNVMISGNIIEESAAWGLLIGYSVQQDAGCNNIIVSNNLFVRNGRSIDTPFNGEIMIGRPWGTSPRSIKDITVSNNRFQIDGTHGIDKGSFISIGYNAENVQVLNNSIGGKANSSKRILTIWRPVKNLFCTNNIWAGKGEASFGKEENSTFKYLNNTGVKE